MSFGKCFTKFKTKLDVRSLFDAHFSSDTTKVLSLLARYLSLSTSKYHKNLTQHDREIDNQTVSAQFETYSNFWIPPCIQCYAHAEKSSGNVKDNVYNLLAAGHNKAPRADIIVVMGDLNAKVGADRRTLEHVMGNQGIGIRNDNG